MVKGGLVVLINEWEGATLSTSHVIVSAHLALVAVQLPLRTSALQETAVEDDEKCEIDGITASAGTSNMSPIEVSKLRHTDRSWNHASSRRLKPATTRHGPER